MTPRRSGRVFTVGLNLLWLVPGDVGGTEEYAVRLLRVLPELINPERITFEVYATPATAEAHPWLVDVGRVLVSPDPGESRMRRISVEATWLRNASSQRAFVHHLGGTLPLRNRTPALLTVHDLQPFDRPEAFSPTKRAWLQRRLPISIRESTVVMTPTQHVADQIVDRFGTNRQRLAIVASSHGGPVDLSVPAEPELDRPYVIYPAITYPHKNHQVLIEAFGRLGADVDLVLTGRADEAEPDVVAAIERAGLGARVHRLGRVPESRYRQLLAGATALAFPSLNEGFGLPLIEAMAAGVPVVASDLPVLREVSGGAATLVAGDDSAAWAKALDAVLGPSGAERDAIVTAGKRRAADFSPTESAQRLVEVYNRVLGLSA